VTASDICPACHTAGLEIFHEQSGVPAHSVLLMDSRDMALGYPTGNLRLGLCNSCGFITNTAFDVTLNDYNQHCEESQGFSPFFRGWLSDVAKRFVDRYDLHDKTVLEIGCGKGEFLALCCELGPNDGIGIDPAYIPGRLESSALDRIEFIVDLYSEAYAGRLIADAVAHRHTLEHIHPVAEHVKMVRGAANGSDAVPFFWELPETLRVLEDVAFWDVYYEHCSYFTPGSLARLLRQEGYDLLDLRLEYDDQYILLEARTGSGTGTPALDLEDDLERTRAAVAHFRAQYPIRIAELRELIEGVHADGGRTVIWGAGSKGVAFLTTMGCSLDELGYAVDINPHKQGKFMAGTGQEVVGPEFLAEYKPSLVLVMNSVYLDEIGRTCADLGVDARLVGV
jgi:SAM-dependent methyltransferase